MSFCVGEGLTEKSFDTFAQIIEEKNHHQRKSNFLLPEDPALITSSRM
jgi:hypothetical protein